MKKVDMSKIAKTAGVVLIGIFALLLGVNLVQALFRVGSVSHESGMTAPAMPLVDSAQYYGETTKGYSMSGASAPSLSLRNVSPLASSGNTAEQFEVTDYTAHIETGALADTCAAVLGLKGLNYVVFENSNKYDRGCSYAFKAEKDHVEEILAAIEELNPKTVSENSYTIKRQIDDFTSEEEILKNKLESIDQTLKNATGAYDEVTRLATRSQDVATLAKIIDSKIQIIERLTEERLAVGNQLDQLSRSKADQLDRLDYTYFSVDVSENRYIDTASLKDSWKAAVRQFVQTVNKIVQDSTISLVVFLLFLVQVAIYLFVALLAAKYGWNWIKKICCQ